MLDLDRRRLCSALLSPTPPRVSPDRLNNSQPAFNKSRIHYMDRGEKYRFGLRKEKRLTQIQMELGWDDDDLHMAEGLLGTPLFRQLSYGLPHADSAASSADLPASFNLHRSMCMKTLRAQTTEERKELFLRPAERYEIIGASMAAFGPWLHPC